MFATRSGTIDRPGKFLITQAGMPIVINAVAMIADKAVKRLVELLDSKDPRVALQACRELFDRVYGRALTTAEISIEDNRAAPDFDKQPMAPEEVSVALKDILEAGERELKLEPLPDDATNKERVERILAQPILPPTVYAALCAAKGTRH
jgi:hypothetical protein